MRILPFTLQRLFLGALGITAVILLLLTTTQQTNAAPHTQSGCVIPPSGPWPPCATGGNSNANNNGCVIPPSGPWPPCATDGSQSAPTTETNSSGGCVIPSSGPWPPCATDGSQSTATANNSCIIPDSGPWPPCASNGSTSAPVVNQTPELLYFNADKTYVAHDDTITLSWGVADAQYVLIRPLQHYMSLHTISDLPTTGSQTIDLREICDADGIVEFEISARTANGQFVSLGSLTVASQSFDWFMRLANDQKPLITPCAPAEQIQAVTQQFEHGEMIWLASSQTIYILFDETTTTPRVWRSFDDTFVSGEPESDPAIVPPAGLQQPVRGFGKVWRDNLEIRSALGWATNGEQGYVTTMQSNRYCYGIRCGKTMFMTKSDGKTLWHIWRTGSVFLPQQWSEQAFTFD